MKYVEWDEKPCLISLSQMTNNYWTLHWQY